MRLLVVTHSLIMALLGARKRVAKLMRLAPGPAKRIYLNLYLILPPVFLIEGKRMSDPTNARTLSRRQFGVLAAAGAAATALVGQEIQQPNVAPTRLAPGSF